MFAGFVFLFVLQVSQLHTVQTFPGCSALGCLVPSHAAPCDADLAVLVCGTEGAAGPGWLGVAMLAVTSRSSSQSQGVLNCSVHWHWTE